MAFSGNCQDPDRCVGAWIVSKPRIRSDGASAVSLETQSTIQTATAGGGGKGGDFTYLNPTTYWCHPDSRFTSFFRIRDVEVPGY